LYESPAVKSASSAFTEVARLARLRPNLATRFMHNV
jgi:hypothetical protein